MIQIRKAERRKTKLLMGLSGPSGSGKTHSALRMAFGIGGKILMVDAEKGRGEEKSSLFGDFDYARLNEPYSPERYTEAIHDAEELGYDVLILDGISPEWADDGGVLRMVDDYGQDKRAAWGKYTPVHDRFVKTMMSEKLHVIATIRAKHKPLATVDDSGKAKKHVLGMDPIQRPGIEYEFSFFFDLAKDGNLAHIWKAPDDCKLSEGNRPFLVTEKTGEAIQLWLEAGIDAPVVEEKIAAGIPRGESQGRRGLH